MHDAWFEKKFGVELSGAQRTEIFFANIFYIFAEYKKVFNS